MAVTIQYMGTMRTIRFHIKLMADKSGLSRHDSAITKPLITKKRSTPAAPLSQHRRELPDASLLLQMLVL
jgi:hypothetical protein